MCPRSTIYTHVLTKFIRSMSHSVAEPDLTKCDMFLGHNNIVINQSDFKNNFIVFVKFRLIISVCCLYISVIHLSFPLILGITHVKVRFRCWEMVKIKHFD